MAVEKILNTRLQLKYDSYANWTSTSLGEDKGANFILKAGEIGICYLPTNSNEQQVTGSQPPQILFKVGNGSSKFSALPWASAKAADVYEWAKQANLPVTKEGNGNVVSGIAWDENTKGIKFTTASVATSEGLAQLTERVKTIEDTYATDAELAEAVLAINNAIGTLSNLKTEAKGTIVAAINEIHDERDNLEGSVNKLGETLETVKSTANETHTSLQNLLQDFSGLTKNVEGNSSEITTLKDSLAEGGATANAIADAKKAGTDAQANLDKEIIRAQAAEKANADAIERLTNGVSQEEIDGVNDLINYVNEHGPEVQGMKKDIADNAKAISDEASRADTEEKRLAGLINTNTQAIAALNAADGKVANATKADTASSLDATGIAQVKAIQVDKATDADKLGGAAAADYLKKNDAPGYGDILTKTSAATLYQPVGNYATASQGAKADTAVQPAVLNDYYTKTQADAAFMDSTETDNAIDAKITALNLATTYEPIGAENRAKAYADGLAGNYATAAQGAKADTALQEITTTANGGLKVTNKNQIDFDSNVVFVFNCGDSQTVL